MVKRHSSWVTVDPHSLRYDRFGPSRDRTWDSVGGVYAIYRGGTIVYIGSAARLAERVREHIKGYGMCGGVPGYASYRSQVQDVRGPWSLKLRPARFYGEWATLELRLIRRLRPTLNVRVPAPPPKYARATA